LKPIHNLKKPCIRTSSEYISDHDRLKAEEKVSIIFF